MRGAVTTRIERSLQEGVTLKACKRSYGICVSQPYTAFHHEESDRYDDSFTGDTKAREQVVWLIKHGDVLRSDKPTRASMQFTQKFARGAPRFFLLDLVSYDHDRLPIPTRLPDVLAGMDPWSHFLLCALTLLRPSKTHPFAVRPVGDTAQAVCHGT